jgi:hypothetical protein
MSLGCVGDGGYPPSGLICFVTLASASFLEAVVEVGGIRPELCTFLRNLSHSLMCGVFWHASMISCEVKHSMGILELLWKQMWECGNTFSLCANPWLWFRCRIVLGSPVHLPLLLVLLYLVIEIEYFLRSSWPQSRVQFSHGYFERKCTRF